MDLTNNHLKAFLCSTVTIYKNQIAFSDDNERNFYVFSVSILVDALECISWHSGY